MTKSDCRLDQGGFTEFMSALQKREGRYLKN